MPRLKGEQDMRLIRKFMNMLGTRYLVTAYKFGSDGHIVDIVHCSESTRKAGAKKLSRSNAPMEYVKDVLLIDGYDRLDIHKLIFAKHDTYECFVKDGNKIIEL